MANDVAYQKYAEQNLTKLDRIIGLLEELLDFQKELLSLREEQVAQLKKKKPVVKKLINKPVVKKPVVKKKK